PTPGLVELDTRRRTESEIARFALDAEPARLVARLPDVPELVADGVEVRVARDGERLLQVHRTELLLLGVAEGRVADPHGAGVGVVVADAPDLVVRHRERRHELERRARRVQTLGRAIDERE